MATSQNGWPAAPDLDRRTFEVAGVEFVGGIVDDDEVAAVLGYVLGEFHRRVERLHNPGCWGFSFRANRNSPNDLSNHSSGTAVDANAPLHPNGVPTSKTFEPWQIAEIHKILSEVGHVVRWGGDYTHTPDSMHFEINATRQAVARAAFNIQQEDDMQLSDKIDPKDDKSPTVGGILRQLDRFMERQDARAKRVLTAVDKLPNRMLTKGEVTRAVALALEEDDAR